MGPTNARGPFCLPLRLPCTGPMAGEDKLLPGCAAEADAFWKNFFFFFLPCP